MIFLQIPEIDVKEIADSLKAANEAAEAMLREDPRQYFEMLMGEAILFCLKLVAAIVIFAVGIWIISKIKKAFRKRFERRKTDKTISSFTMSFLSFMSYAILILICIGTLGVNTTSIAALLAAGGMAIGMALSGTVQNFAGGIMILAFKPFKVGDYIEAQGYAGTVSDISIVSTRILTVDNKVIFLPNGALSNGNINNFSGRPVRRVEWKVSVEYDSDADACIELIKALLSRDKRILDSSVPEAKDPFAALFSLNESDITFIARAWVRQDEYWNVYFDINKALYTELPRNGFTFAYPHITISNS